jgi:hypothetical protein
MVVFLDLFKKEEKSEVRSSRRINTNIVGSLETSLDSLLIRMNNLSEMGASIVCPYELNDKSYLMIKGIYLNKNGILEVSQSPRGAIIVREEKMRNGIKMGIKFLDHGNDRNSFDKIYNDLLNK